MGNNSLEGRPARGAGRLLKIVAGLSVVAVAGLVAGVAVATIPDSGGVIHGCMANGSGLLGPAKGTVRIIDTATDKCQANETAVQWNQTGPSGPAGAQGPAGPQGPKGDPGASASVACPPPATAAPTGASVSIFAKVAGAPGESTDAVHRNEIDVTSYTGGLMNDSCGKAGSKPVLAPVIFGHRFDTASPPLALDAVSAATVPDATFTFTKNGPNRVDFLTVALTNVLVSGIQTMTNGDLPSESVTLNYTRIKMSYQMQRPDGTLGTPVTFCWDQAVNAAC
jgi:type VI secretion system secreted protein Hcp